MSLHEALAISSGSCISRKFPPKQKIWNVTVYHDLSFAFLIPISFPFCLHHLSHIFFLIHLTHQPKSRSRKPQSFLWAQLLLYASSWNSIWSYCFRPTPPVRAIFFLLHLSSPHLRGGLGRTGHEGKHCTFSSPSQSSFGVRIVLITLSGNMMLCWAL